MQWFTVEEQLKIVTIWQTMFALANLVSSLFGYGFYQLHGAQGLKTAGLFNWQWMLLTIGLISAIATGRSERVSGTETVPLTATSVIVLLFLPDSPVQAKWASAEDKVKFVERVRGNDQGIKQKVFRRDQALEVLRDPLPWLLFLMILIQTLVIGGLNT